MLQHTLTLERANHLICALSVMCVILGSFDPYASIGLILLHYRQPLEIKSNSEKQAGMACDCTHLDVKQLFLTDVMLVVG